MYFAVFLLRPSIHVIIPKTWIEGIDDHWEKFVNHSLNHNQIFRCFYSKEPNALDTEKRPNVNFVPKFELDATEFPNEGCYLGKLVFFKRNYDAANERLKKRRSIAPGLYNERRLYEVPIPRQVHQTVAQENENSEINSDIEQEELFDRIGSISPERQIRNFLINENDDSFELTSDNSSTKTPNLAPSPQNDPLFNDQSNVGSSKSGETEEPSSSNAPDNESLLQTTQDESLVCNNTYQNNQSNNIDGQNDLFTGNADNEATISIVTVKTEPNMVIEQPESNREELEALLNGEVVVRVEGMLMTWP